MGNLYSASKTGMKTFQYVVGSTTVVTNTQPCWADATFGYPVSLDLGVNAVDHTVPSNNTGVTLNAYVWSCSTPSFSSPANSAIPTTYAAMTLRGRRGRCQCLEVLETS